jgi:UDP-perosamine 4-acetyltransferase
MSGARPIVIVGNGGHARVVADICRLAGRRVEGLLDSQGSVSHVAGTQVLGGDALLDDRSFVDRYDFVIGIAYQNVRRRLGELLTAKGAVMATVVHPRAIVASEVTMGSGVVVVAGAIVNPNVTLGDLVIVNTGAIVDHDCRLDAGVHVGPGATVTGGVVCGEWAFVGAGAVVIPGRTIGPRTVVGAGSVVVTDFASDLTVAGCPARVIKAAGD